MRRTRVLAGLWIGAMIGLLSLGLVDPLQADQEVTAESSTTTESQGAEVLSALDRYFEFEGDLRESDLRVLDEVLPSAEGDSPGSIPLRLTIAAAEAQEAGDTSLLARYAKIVGGLAAMPGEFPWQAALVAAGYPPRAGQFCGGSIVASTWILTAAHCVHDTAPSQIYVFAGNEDLANAAAQTGYVAEIYEHQWNPISQHNDIALIRLETGFDLAVPGIGVVSLSSSTPPDGALLTVTGWGATSEGGSGTAHLKKVTVPVVNWRQCNDAAFYGGAVLEGMLCAGIGGRDSCQGDSGGALVDMDQSPQQVGVVSWGYGCARPNKPGVYTDVAKYAQWITSTMRP